MRVAKTDKRERERVKSSKYRETRKRERESER